MDKLTKGTWIINSIKHIIDLKTNTTELTYFGATETSGKAGMLLSRLVADEQEIIPQEKLFVFARESGITRPETLRVLSVLQNAGKVDFTSDHKGEPNQVEVYCFSSKDAIETASDIYERMEPSQYEEANISSLEITYELPRFEKELIEELCARGFTEEVSANTANLQRTLELVKTQESEQLPERVYYNEYICAGDPVKISNALKCLKSDEKQAVQDILYLVQETPGLLFDNLNGMFQDHVLKMMEGIGLLDCITVHSRIGDAVFVTSPHLRGIGVRTNPLSEDIFHKAKILLACLRFGQVKSASSRGKITTNEMLLNIVNKLIRGFWVGPCTAIGQDYQILEKDGVIETRPSNWGMYEMKLRQKEVGILAKQMIEFKKVIPEADIELGVIFQNKPESVTIPEERRKNICAVQTKGVRDIRDRIFQAFRTGMR